MTSKERVLTAFSRQEPDRVPIGYSANGGYALAPTHQLQDNSPTENVVAMYDAAKKYGAY